MTDPLPATYIISSVLLILLIIQCSFLGSMEKAVDVLNKVEIRTLAENGNIKAKKLEKYLGDPNKFITTMKIGVFTSVFFFVGIILYVYSNLVASLFVPFMDINLAIALADILLIIIGLWIMLSFGYIFPRRVAMRNPEKHAMDSIKLGSFYFKLIKPFRRVVIGTVNILCKIFRVKITTDDAVSEEEIMDLIESSNDTGGISDTEKEMIDSVFEFNDISAEEIMTPRTDVFMIDINEPLENYVDEMLKENYSRVPVYEDDIDNIIGILYLKDFLNSARSEGFTGVDIRKILRKPFFVPARKKINELFKQLQAAKTHMAILIDEYGGFAGIVTIEDLIEEIMGNIDDEFDEDESLIKKIEENTYRASGVVTISELNETLNLELDDESQDYDTLAGLILFTLGYIPSQEEHPVINYENLTFTVEKIEDKRIDSVLVHINPEVKNDEEEKDSNESK